MKRFFWLFAQPLASTQLIVACVTAYFILSVAADAQIVALGASDVAGYSVVPWQTWPAQLQNMLKAKGYNVHVKNAGKPGDIPSGLLHRLNAAVPSGTKIVILATEALYANNQKASLATQQKGGRGYESSRDAAQIARYYRNSGECCRRPTQPRL
jgi:hypothetical protein